MKLIAITLLLVSCSLPSKNNTAHNNEVYLLPTIHGLHFYSHNYSLHHLREVLGQVDPDIVGFEVRSEDWEKKNLAWYPYEMKYTIPNWSKKNGKTLLAVDWYEPEKVSAVKDSSKKWPDKNKLRYEKSKAFELDKWINEQETVNAPLKLDSFTNQKWNRSVVQRQEEFNKHFPDNPWFRYAKKRDLNISKNIFDAWSKNPTKKILISLGAEHTPIVKDILQKKFNLKARLVKPGQINFSSFSLSKLTKDEILYDFHKKMSSSKVLADPDQFPVEKLDYHFKLINEQRPKLDSQLKVALAKYYFVVKQYGESLKILRKLKEDESQYDGATLMTGIIFDTIGDREKAKKEYKALLNSGLKNIAKRLLAKAYQR